MSVEQKVEQARQELKKKDIKRGKEGKFRKETWRERFGFFRIMWIFVWGVLGGSAWTYVVLEAPGMFQSKSVIIINNAEAKTIEKVEELKGEIVEVIHTNRVAELAEMIYNLESSSGKNNYSKCEAIGKVNGIGYGIPGNGKYQCFDNHEDEMQVLKGWIIDKQAKGMTENELLCLYSGNNYKICKK